MNKIQCCVCKCGSIVAACTEPECWQDPDWLSDVKIQLSKGRNIEMREPGKWKLESCKCSETPISPSPREVTDEEIKDKSDNYSMLVGYRSNFPHHLESSKEGFSDGARWMRDLLTNTK